MPCSNFYIAILLSNFIICCYFNFAVTHPTVLHIFIRCMLDYITIDLNQNILRDLTNDEVIPDQLIQGQNKH